MVKDKYLKESLNTQRLNELATKYGLSNYMPGQSFDNIKDKMTAEDYEMSQKLTNYYTNQKSLTDNYNFNNEIIESNRQKSIENNRISRELAMKYLPEQLKSLGMGGLGVSESSIISMNNNFRNNSNDINSDAELRKNELLKNYQDDIRNLDNSATTESQNIRDKYQKQFEDNSAATLTNVNTLIMDKLSTMTTDSQGRISEEDKKILKEIVNGSRSEMTEQDQKIIDSYINNIQTRPQEEVKAEKEYNSVKTTDQKKSGTIEFNGNGKFLFFGQDDFSEGDNFSLKTSDGKELRVESGGKVEDSEIIQAALGVQNNTVFGYRNQIYLKRDGAIYLIRKRKNSYESHYSAVYDRIFG